MKWLRWGGLLACLLFIAVFFTQASMKSSESTEAQLLEAVNYIYGNNVTIAALPANFPLDFELPIPENTHIVASSIYPHPNQMQHNNSQGLNILLRSEDIEPSVVAEFYQAYFLKNGWRELTFQYDATMGFYASNSIGASYCLGQDYHLSYNIWKSVIGEDETIDWSMTIVTHPNEAECLAMGTDYRQLSDFFPQFKEIEGAELLPYVSVNAMHIPEISTSYTTGLRLSIPMGDVFEAYNQQLRDANWREQSSEINNTFAISDWTIDTDALGLLYGRLVILQKTTDSQEYTAYLSIEIR